MTTLNRNNRQSKWHRNFGRNCFYLSLVLSISTIKIASAWFLQPLSMDASDSRRTQRSKSTGLFGWSIHAEGIENKDCDNDLLIIDLKECHSTITSNQDGRLLDLSSPREWLEYWEDRCGGQPGAYTVLKCDYQCCIGEGENPWVIWGQEYHVQRLQDSWTCLFESTILDFEELDKYKHFTKIMIDRLISEAEVYLSKKTTENRDFQTGLVVPVMLSILWQKDHEKARNHPLINGHICSSCVPIQPMKHDPGPCSVVLAMPRRGNSWPNRTLFHPEAKLSSWCSQRRSLEQSLKKDGIGEVLLVDHQTSSAGGVEILEGLITNVFFVYPGGKLRTAQHNVLGGYARHLVLQVANDCGLKVDPQSVAIHDADLWQEVFLTSSIRIIAPVHEIVIPQYKISSPREVASSFRSVWSRKDRPHYDEIGLPKWRQLYAKILLHQYVGQCEDRGILYLNNMMHHAFYSSDLPIHGDNQPRRLNE